VNKDHAGQIPRLELACGWSKSFSESPGTSRNRGIVIVTVADQVTVQTIPAEVIYLILRHVDKTQLVSFALTCRRYQPEAERLLYKSIKFAKCDENTRACLKTLAAVPRTALFVQSFWIYWTEPLNGPIYPFLGEALLAMTSLKVLHLRFYDEEHEAPRTVMNSFLRYAGGILSSSRVPNTTQLLRRCTFSLRTLFLPDDLDLEKWIPQQKDLTSIGLYITRGDEADDEQLSVYKALMEDERHLNVWSITEEDTHIDAVHAYPVFARQWTAEPIARLMGHLLPFSWANKLDLHVMDLSDHDVIGPIVSSVARYLPQIDRLRFVVRNRDIHLVRSSSARA
jgi:hypothetical protein